MNSGACRLYTWAGTHSGGVFCTTADWCSALQEEGGEFGKGQDSGRALTASWQCLKHPSFIPHCSETLFLKPQHFFVKWHSWSGASQKRQSLRLSVQLQPRNDQGKEKKKSITTWQLVLTLSGMGWWAKANWSKVKHFFVFVCVCFFFSLNDSSWQRPSAEKSTEPASPQKNGPSSYKRFQNICLSPGTSPMSLPSKPHACWMDISDYKYNR